MVSMSKFLRRASKYSKKSVKVFLRVCDFVTKEIFTYKKTLVGFSLLFIFGLLFFFGKDMISTTLAKTVVVSESEILRRVGTHTSLPKELPTDIVRVKDAEVLRAQHMFYKDIKEGDYIIMYPNRVIIYDLRANVVIAEKSSQ